MNSSSSSMYFLRNFEDLEFYILIFNLNEILANTGINFDGKHTNRIDSQYILVRSASKQVLFGNYALFNTCRYWSDYNQAWSNMFIYLVVLFTLLINWLMKNQYRICEKCIGRHKYPIYVEIRNVSSGRYLVFIACQRSHICRKRSFQHSW